MLSPAHCQPSWKVHPQVVVRAFLSGCLRLVFVFVLVVLVASSGCHRTAYRHQADSEVAALIQRGQVDPRWKLRKSSVYPQREARFYDPYCPDAEPMPPDDPVSHQLMHYVDGKKGWPHWHDNGDTFYVENPFWRAYLPRDERGIVVLDRAKAVDIALVHSREYQRQLENLYLSALNVTAERFRFDVQFFGGHSTFFTADGPQRAGGSRSLLELDTDARATKLGATGAELLIGFANSLVWQYSGGDSYASASLLNFSLVQPLLRAGGRHVVLESLTQAERNLLANIRQMAHYQRGFYLQIVTGTNPGTGPSPGGLTIGSLSPGVSPGRGGVLGLLQSQVQIRNQEQNVLGLEDSYEQLLAAHQADRIDRYQVDLALQSLYNAQSRLLSLRTAYQSQLDSFKLTLGLPPDLPVEISDNLLEQFDFIDPKLLNLQRETTLLNRALRDPATPEPPDWLDRLRSIYERVSRQVEIVREDIDRLNKLLPERRVRLREFYSRPVTGEETLEGLTQAEKAIADLDERARAVNEDFQLLLEGKLPAARGERRVERRPMKDVLDEFKKFIDDPDGVANARVAELEKQVTDVQARLKAAEEELSKLSEQMAQATAEEASALQTKYADARAQMQTLQSQLDSLQENLAKLKKAPKEQVALQILEPLLLQISDLSLVQARARLDCVMLTPVDITPEEALEIARENRLDWMNARAALVDQWRQIQIAANRLRSDLDVTFSGDVRTLGDNPFGFNSNTGELRVGFRFDAPFTRLLERNQYRTALINFQRARRDYMAFEDQIAQSLRDTLRNIRLGQSTFELRRSAVLVSIAQVDLARERLRAPPRPGETSQFGVNTARDLVQALSSLLDAENAFLGAWVDYEVQRMILDFQMGTMQLDERGQWIDPGPIRGQSALEGSPFQPETLPTPQPQTGVQPLPPLTQNRQENSGESGGSQPVARANLQPQAEEGGLMALRTAMGHRQGINQLSDDQQVPVGPSTPMATSPKKAAPSSGKLSPAMERLRERLAAYRKNTSQAGPSHTSAEPPGDSSIFSMEDPRAHSAPNHDESRLIQAMFGDRKDKLPDELLPPLQALLEMEEEGVATIQDNSPAK
ncbi:TolC family protein [Thermogutta sp.]|uniref:TolC family protein n=1 Tax=Thermogutta sp. TaxID=1962930 RepID=UPI003C7E070E